MYGLIWHEFWYGKMPAISYSNLDHLCLGRTIFVVIIDPAGPFMLYIFGPAGPFMHPDHIFLYRSWPARTEPRKEKIMTKSSVGRVSSSSCSSVSLSLCLSIISAFRFSPKQCSCHVHSCAWHFLQRTVVLRLEGWAKTHIEWRARRVKKPDKHSTRVGRRHTIIIRVWQWGQEWM